MNILITHGYSDSNKGDLAITLACYEYVRSKYPNAKITLHSTFRNKNKAEFQYHNRFMSNYNIEIKQGILPTPYSSDDKSVFYDLLAVYRLLKETIQLKLTLFVPLLGKLLGGKQYKAVQDVKSADLILIKGGQFIYNEEEDLRGNLFLWRTLQPIKTAFQLNKKVIIFGQSFGGFASEKSEKVAAKYLNYCSRIYAREKVSYAFLEKHNLAHKAETIPDLAFYLKKKVNNTPSVSLPSNEKYMGVTMVNWHFPESKNPKQAKINYIKSIVSACIHAKQNHGLSPLFIPQVTVRHHGKSDNDIIHETIALLKQQNIVSHFYEKDLSVFEMMDLYKGCEFLIGTRLHSCILAANVATPILPIRYQGFKTQGIVKELNQENLLLDIHNLSEKELIDNIDNIMNNKKNIKEQLEKRTTSFIHEFDEIDFDTIK
ncbi:polysaccharide pyruvyl transferase family protein [Ulvibacter litoralis]|uniref:Colanic acid/amylovoran biosynthesis protein n=1 Tax=Ulvibacter litoralis TaxID=227084 RepID=A0A1G7D8F3_9FLAO|nr:polysaccharide pyruvyl transferase family protein [Ulvibacter litoralis]GHC44469.1 hypothetical protein GCM10008083_03770 [Ulvibacter litoralis]SDE47928.1 colanic acid/amylovoran biosynthesis protein [Ulvibacter litoralis]